MTKLLRSQSNQLFQEMENAGLNPRQFMWLDSSDASDEFGPGSEALIHPDSEYYFVLGEGTAVKYSPGATGLVDLFICPTWEATVQAFVSWTENLRRELSQPDLWQEAFKGTDVKTPEAITEAQDTPFTTDEAQQIKESIESLKEHLREQDLINEANQAYVSGQLDYLTNQIPRQGRWTWVQLAIGVLVPLAVTLQLSSDQARTLFNLFKQMVGHIINIPLSLPLS